MRRPAEEARNLFNYIEQVAFPPRPYVIPASPIGIVRAAYDGRPEFTLVRWGFVPSWAKEIQPGRPLINARAETVYEKASFKNAIRRRRCLIPANGFYEWTGPKSDKRPYLIGPRGGGLMAFAGLWEHWQGADGSELETMAILTTSANATLEPIHDRMPVILATELFEGWLDARALDAKDAARLLVPAPADLLEAVAVDKAISNSRRDGPELQRPAGEQKRLI